MNEGGSHWWLAKLAKWVSIYLSGSLFVVLAISFLIVLLVQLFVPPSSAESTYLALLICQDIAYVTSQ